MKRTGRPHAAASTDRIAPRREQNTIHSRGISADTVPRAGPKIRQQDGAFFGGVRLNESEPAFGIRFPGKFLQIRRRLIVLPELNVQGNVKVVLDLLSGVQMEPPYELVEKLKQREQTPVERL